MPDISDIKLAATQSTPAIATSWTRGRLVMRGDSYPENSLQFFSPLLRWVKRYLGDAEEPLALELYLLYLNTSSVKAMMDIFDMLEDAHSEGRKVSVTWYYDPENERVAELAEEFKEDCSFPFVVIPREEDEEDEASEDDD